MVVKGTIWCLHGAVGMADDWRGFSVPGWAVKRIDLWRFLDCCPMSLEAFGEALNREAEATEGRKVLLGYSMGGRLALHALLGGRTSGGDLWDAAVMVSAHPGLESEDERLKRCGRDAEWAAKALSGDWRAFLEEWNGQAVLRSATGQGSDLKADGRVALEPRRQAVARSFMDWSLGVQQPLWGRLEEIDCPLLWCVGERDEKFRALGERVAEEMAQCKAQLPFELGLVGGAGHRLPWEAPGPFAKMVGEFLERADS